jgi:hypothetical protein
MSAEHMLPNQPAPLDTPTLVARCRAIADRLDAATALAPSPLQMQIARRERDLSQLRDGLIARLRAAVPDDDIAHTRAALTGINIALSLVVGVEYPSGALDRTLLTQAATILRGVATG